MELTTIAEVKHVLTGYGETDVSDDTVLAKLITVVSKEAEVYLGRSTLTTSYTEYFNVERGEHTFPLKAYPVTSITSVKNDPLDWAWASTSALSTTSYTCDLDSGRLYIIENTLISGFRGLQVIYTGGMAATTTAFVASYPDLSNAIARQVAYYFKTSKHVGTQGVNLQSGGVSFLGDVKWLRSTQDVLDQYKKVVV